jgi:hypothetical protein
MPAIDDHDLEESKTGKTPESKPVDVPSLQQKRVTSPPVAVYGQRRTSRRTQPEQCPASRSKARSDAKQNSNRKPASGGTTQDELYCDHIRCSYIRAPAKGYLMEHYKKIHHEKIIPAWTNVPLADLEMRPPWWRCELCLGRIDLSNLGRRCDNCPQLEYPHSSAREPLSEVESNREGSSRSVLNHPLQELHELKVLVLHKSSRKARIINLLRRKSKSNQIRRLSITRPEGAEKKTSSPKPDIWIPPEVPEHW